MPRIPLNLAGASRRKSAAREARRRRRPSPGDPRACQNHVSRNEKCRRARRQPRSYGFQGKPTGIASDMPDLKKAAAEGYFRIALEMGAREGNSPPPADMSRRRSSASAPRSFAGTERQFRQRGRSCVRTRGLRGLRDANGGRPVVQGNKRSLVGRTRWARQLASHFAGSVTGPAFPV